MKLTSILTRCLPRPVKTVLKEAINQRFGVPTMERSLGNMRRLGFRPAGVVDVGAYLGEWTVTARSIFPEAAFFMIEAQESKREALEEVKGRNGASVNYRIALLGAASREYVEFHQYENAPTASSVLAAQSGAPGRLVHCKMETLDSVLNQAGFGRPDLIKIDVQGYELEVLKGGPEALAAAEAIVMEVSLIELYRGNPLLPEVIAFMLERGFQCYDIPGLLRRPADGVLWQIDMIFVKAGSPLLKDKTGVVPEASNSGSRL
jgi:FkbM family methyltransferase